MPLSQTNSINSGLATSPCCSLVGVASAASCLGLQQPCRGLWVGSAQSLSALLCDRANCSKAIVIFKKVQLCQSDSFSLTSPLASTLLLHQWLRIETLRLPCKWHSDGFWEACLDCTVQPCWEKHQGARHLPAPQTRIDLCVHLKS